jgi:hypothetical protein
VQITKKGLKNSRILVIIANFLYISGYFYLMAWAINIFQVFIIILTSTFIQQFNYKVLYFVGKNLTQNIKIVEISEKNAPDPSTLELHCILCF